MSKMTFLRSLQTASEAVAYTDACDLEVSQTLYFRIGGEWVEVNPIETLGGEYRGLNIKYDVVPHVYTYIQFLFNGKVVKTYTYDEEEVES